MTKIYGYIHLAIMGHWKEVQAEMNQVMCLSGLLENVTQIHYGVAVDNIFDFPLLKLESDQISLSHVGELSVYEYGTQQILYDDCVNAFTNEKWLDRNDINEPVYVFYCCNAGVSHPPDHDHYPHWRHLMSHWNHTRWKDCVAMLDQGYDTVGVEWQTDPVPHWSGNFWWATAEYIASLPDPENMKTFDVGRGINHVTHPRHGAEWWIGMNPKCKYKSLFQTGYSWRNRPRKDWLTCQDTK